MCQDGGDRKRPRGFPQCSPWRPSTGTGVGEVANHEHDRGGRALGPPVRKRGRSRHMCRRWCLTSTWRCRTSMRLCRDLSPFSSVSFPPHPENALCTPGASWRWISGEVLVDLVAERTGAALDGGGNRLKIVRGKLYEHLVNASVLSVRCTPITNMPLPAERLGSS